MSELKVIAAFRGVQALTLLSLSLIRMIEDCGQSGDTMADRRQLFVEMSKCSGPNPRHDLCWTASLTAIKKTKPPVTFREKCFVSPHVLSSLSDALLDAR